MLFEILMGLGALAALDADDKLEHMQKLQMLKMQLECTTDEEERAEIQRKIRRIIKSMDDYDCCST
jgi:hypothetical protein